jgi:hypothetical protein
MDKIRQAVSVLAICASVLLAGMIIASTGLTEAGVRSPVGVPPAIGTMVQNTGQTTSTILNNRSFRLRKSM